MIHIRDLSKRYGSNTVFEKLNFSVPRGDAVAIVGRSGCGKSTLLHLLAVLATDYHGHIDLAAPPERRSLVLQNFGLFPWKNIRENMELPLTLRGIAPKARKQAAEALLEELGLNGLDKRYPSQLSGGEQQRVALGRALITAPDILLLDEPFSSLDAITREHLQDVLANLWRQHGFTLVLVTHSIEEAVFLGKKILVLGGTPVHITAALDNLGGTAPGARSTEIYFNLVTTVRTALENVSENGATP